MSEKIEFRSETDEYLWWQLKSAVDSRGEFVDPEVEFGVIRRSVFDFPSVKARMSITEHVDPNDLDGPLAYQTERSDWRGQYNVRVSAASNIGALAFKVISWDLRRYQGETEQSMKHVKHQDQGRINLMKSSQYMSKANVTVDSLQQDLLMSGLSKPYKKLLREKLEAAGYDEEAIVSFFQNPILRIPSENEDPNSRLVPARR